MTRAEYMAKLSEKLYFIPETQRKAILDYYEEMMADRMEDGMDEDSAVVAMENPDTIAERLKAEGNFPMEEAQADNPENLTDEAMKFSSLAGSLTVYSVEHNSRLRKYYAITEDGRQRIADFLAEWADVKRVYDFIAEVNGDA